MQPKTGTAMETIGGWCTVQNALEHAHRLLLVGFTCFIKGLGCMIVYSY